MFQVVAGEDPDDPVTARGTRPHLPDYAAVLAREACAAPASACCGRPTSATTTDAEVVQVFMAAVEDLDAPARRSSTPRGAGSTASAVRRLRAVQGFKYDINAFFAAAATGCR